MLLLLLSCLGRVTPDLPAPEPVSRPPTTRPTPSFRADPDQEGLVVRLYDAAPPIGAAEGAPVAEGLALEDEAVDRLLARLPPLEERDGDRSTFALRKASRPPPRAGADVLAPFPPPPGPPPVPVAPAGPPRVVRVAPEGEVELAPGVAVTFDQPMVAVTSQEEAARTVPVTLTPQPPGRWRWLGTKTLVFDAEPRLPMATAYVLEVPRGTRGANGAALDEALRFTFATPPPKLVASWPPERVPTGLEPTILLRFDQRMDPGAVLEHLRVTPPAALRLATEEERGAALAEAGRGWDRLEGALVALRPAAPLPKHTTFHLAVPRGTPSGEGPRTTASEAVVSLSTYAPLRVEQHGCGRRRCPPRAGWFVRTNNRLDPAAFDASAWTVSPEVPGLVVSANGFGVGLRGTFRPRTTYTVTVPAGLTDVFGQTLGHEQRLVVEVGPAEPSLAVPGGRLVVLDPASGAKLPVWTVNEPTLEVEIREVVPEDWVAWGRPRWGDEDAPMRLPGRRVYAGTLETGGAPDERKETPLDLSPHLGPDGVGQFLVRIAVPVLPDRPRHVVDRWVEVTDLGLVALADGERVIGWVSDLATGASASGVTLSLLGEGEAATTGEDGVAELRASAGRQATVLLARRGTDVALLPDDEGGGGYGWARVGRPDDYAWYVADDRGVYRPGETARIKGFVRRVERGPEGDLEPLAVADGTVVRWTLTGARQHELGHGEAPLSAHGGFDVEVDLPDDADLGHAWLSLDLRDGGWIAGTMRDLRIEEFRRPEFEVTVTADPGPHLLGLDARFDLRAAYYAGGGLPAAEATWTVLAAPTAYAPPGLPEFRFGTWAAWWRGPVGRDPYGGRPVGQLEGWTDATGEHHLGVHLESLSPPGPVLVTAEALVQDVNRQAWSARATTLVHPSELYVGLRADRAFVEPGQPIEVGLAVVDLDGRPAPGARVEVTAARLVSGPDAKGRWTEREEDGSPCAVRLDEEGRATCTFRPSVAGSWRVRARVVDADGRPNESELRLWVTGGQVPSRSVALEELELVPEKEELRAGEVARVLVQAPWVPAEGAWTVRRDGVERVVRFRMEEPTTVIEVPIDEGLVPNFLLHVHLVGAAPRLDDAGRPVPGAPPRVAHASGVVPFRVPPVERTLQVTVAPAEATLPPGGRTTLAVSVRDARGEPVDRAEVAVVAVDESVLDLTGYRLPDPIGVMYAARQPGVTDHSLRSLVALGDPAPLRTGAVDVPADTSRSAVLTKEFLEGVPTGRSYQSAVPLERGVIGGSGGNPNMAGGAYNENTYATSSFDPDAAEALAVRTELDALALFAPAVRTRADGTAEVELDLPESLTRYRVMVVAADAVRSFGSAETTVTARKALIVRPSAPRFLNFGDQAELPVVVQNQTDRPLTVDVAVRATNLAFLDQIEPVPPDLGDEGPVTAGRRITVPANDRIEVRFPAATSMAGTARLQVVAAAGELADATALSFPVWTPATTEAFATYGSIEAGAVVQPVQAPPGAWTQFGGLEVTTSSTGLQALTDAVLYLRDYPHETSEVLASRVLAIASLRDVLQAFGSADLPPAAALDAQVSDDLRTLAERQRGDGGWSFWGPGDRSDPYLSIHAANALARAKGKGHAVPDDTFRRAAEHLRRIEVSLPATYSEASRAFLRAYALDVLRRMGRPDLRKARQLYLESGPLLGVDGLAFLLPTLHEGGAVEEVGAIRRTLANRVTETAGAAHFATAYSDGAQVLLHGERRADGIVLEALMETTPDDELVEKVVRGLLAHRTKGRWGNTNESAFVLLALDRYFRQYEAETPDFVARVWLGDEALGDHPFRGRTTERAWSEVPLGYLTEHRGPQPLTLQMDGARGRLYYRVGLRYAPRDLRLEPADYGFAVERTYAAVDDPADVRRAADGTWHVRAGARVRVSLELAAEARRYHVALVDPLPGGVEAENPDLEVTARAPSSPADPGGWRGRWFEHDQLRDERAEAFTSLLRAGVYGYTYVVRATTPGRFVVPPARAEEMYAPETFGRSGTDVVVVE